MTDNQDTKKIAIVIAVIVAILVLFIGVRSCTKKDTNLENNKDNTPVEENNNTTTDENKETDSSTTESNNDGVVSTKDEVKEEVEKVKLEFDLSDEMILDINNTSYKLPEISEDSNGNKVTTTVSYEFKSIDSIYYYNVTKFDTSKLGTYKITYKFTSSDGSEAEHIMYISIEDNVAPTITVNKEVASEVEGVPVIGYEPIIDGGYSNDNTHVAFSDNDQISYAEYFMESKLEVIDGEEVMTTPTVITVEDLDSDLVLYEEGTYHVKAVDRFGNTTTFTFTIDKTPSTILSHTMETTDEGILTTITFNEEVKEVEGWTLSEDKKVITKLFSEEETVELKIYDLAGNSIETEFEVYQVFELKQDEVLVRNNANINTDFSDLELVLHADSDGEFKTENLTLNTISTSEVEAGSNTIVLSNSYGSYTFTYTNSSGIVSTFNVTMSSLAIED